MEKVSVRKNVLLGFVLLYWLIALILLITDRTQNDKDAKHIYVTSLVFTAFTAALCCIPFIGWLAEIPLCVFYIITIVKTFTGNYSYKVPVIGGIIEYFENK